VLVSAGVGSCTSTCVFLSMSCLTRQPVFGVGLWLFYLALSPHRRFALLPLLFSSNFFLRSSCPRTERRLIFDGLELCLIYTTNFVCRIFISPLFRFVSNIFVMNFRSSIATPAEQARGVAPRIVFEESFGLSSTWLGYCMNEESRIWLGEAWRCNWTSAQLRR
jgi:hypothetical protein